jgi:hypothetical protein
LLLLLLLAAAASAAAPLPPTTVSRHSWHIMLAYASAPLLYHSHHKQQRHFEWDSSQYG